MRQFLLILAVLSLLVACTMGYGSHAGAPCQCSLSALPAASGGYDPALRDWSTSPYWPEHGH